MPVQMRPAQVDFSQLAGIGQNIGGMVKDQRLEKVLSSVPRGPNGELDFNGLSNALMQGGFAEEGLKVAQMAQKQGMTPYEEARIKIAQQVADQRGVQSHGRIVNLPDEHGVLQPYRDTPDGPIPIQAPGVGQRFKPMGVNDISKLTEEGTKAKNIGEFQSTFADSYGGYGGGWKAVADLKMLAGRTGWANKDQEAASTWWQGYDKYKTQVRNEMFGSALTPSEQFEFEKADVNPSLDPKTIRQNLKRQHDIIQNALKRKTGALKAGGYNPQVIDEAYGMQPGMQEAATPPAAPPLASSATPTLDANPQYQADMAGGRFSTAAPQPKPEHLQKLQTLLAQFPDPKDQAEIMEEWERKYPQYGRGAADHFLGRDVQAGR
jgi:hypothetical protein